MATTSSLSTFISSTVNTPLLQETFYKVSISNGTYAFDDGNFDFFVQSANLPGKTISTAEIKRHNVTFRLPNTVEFDGTWSVTLLIDNGLKYYNKLLKWQQEFSAMNKSGGGTRTLPTNIATISVLNSTYTTTKASMNLYGFYPSNVGDLEFKQDSNEYVKPTIEFTYSYHTGIDSTDLLG